MISLAILAAVIVIIPFVVVAIVLFGGNSEDRG